MLVEMLHIDVVEEIWPSTSIWCSWFSETEPLKLYFDVIDRLAFGEWHSEFVFLIQRTLSTLYHPLPHM